MVPDDNNFRRSHHDQGVIMSDRDFLHRYLPVVGKHVHRVGLAFSYGIDGAGTEAALAAGINYLGGSFGKATSTLWSKLRSSKTASGMFWPAAQDLCTSVVVSGSEPSGSCGR